MRPGQHPAHRRRRRPVRHASSEVDPATLTEDDAARAGVRSLADAAPAARPPRRARTSTGCEVCLAGADPRVALREQADAVRRRTAGPSTSGWTAWDAARASGPWTREVLRLIAEQPGVRAPDLAASLGRETLPFKRDVRKLKELGLTRSLAGRV